MINHSKMLNIICCVEKGILEQQSTLLIKSLSEFTNSSLLQLIIYSPRSQYLPSKTNISLPISNQIKHVTKPLNQSLTHYPIANKLLACADFEKNNPDATNIMFVDTDTLFLNPIETILYNDKPALYLRPVDNKGPGSESDNDSNDKFWQNVFKQFELHLPKPALKTTVRPAIIRPYYNAGFLWAKNIPGFYQQWLDDFLLLVDSGLRPFGYQSRDGDDFRCLDQIALAVTASRYSEYIKILPETYNYPIPFRPFMKNRNNHPAFDELVHIHYHKWFQHPDFLDHVTSDEDKQSDQYQWLKKQLPLQPTIGDPFKC